MKNKVQNTIKQAAFILTTLLLMLAFMPVNKAEAKKIKIYDVSTGEYIWVEADEDDDDDEDEPKKSAGKKDYKQYAEYFDWDEMMNVYSSVAKKPKNSLYKESQKYDGWTFAGTQKELKAACKDDSVKYICIVPEYYSGRDIPKMTGSEDKILVIPEGKWTNKAKWKEVWLLDTAGYTEKASGSSIVVFKGYDDCNALLTVGKKVKKVKISFSDKAHDDMVKRTGDNPAWSRPADMPALSVTTGASSQVTIDAGNIPCIGTLTVGKKSKVTLIGGAVKVCGNAKAKVTVKDCTYLGCADISISVTDSKNGPQFSPKKMASMTGPSGKTYNYVQMNAGGTVETSGYGLILNLPVNAKKVKVYSKDESSLPFAQLTFTDMPTPDNISSFLPVIYINGKKADSMLLAPSDFKAMLSAFDTVGIKMSDSKAEKVRKLHIWGHDYCWHEEVTNIANEYTIDRDMFTEAEYTYFTFAQTLSGVFYFRNTGCNSINEAMMFAWNYLGVKSYAIVDYDVLNHALNIVELDDGKWYYVDTCPTMNTNFDIDRYPYEVNHHRYAMVDTAFHDLALPNGTILRANVDLWDKPKSKLSDEAVDDVKSRFNFIFQKGTPTPDGSIADGTQKVVDCGLIFGDEYIGYRVAYKNGCSYYEGKEPEILGFTDRGNTKNYGNGYKSFFAVYDGDVFDHFVDANGNIYDWNFRAK